MKKEYDRSTALEAMYALKQLGYKDIQLRIVNEEDVLMLSCNEGHGEWVTPDIAIDSVDDYTNSKRRVGQEPDYWWIFD